jgi:hypothetical protein
LKDTDYKEQWLRKLAWEYDGDIAHYRDTENINWLQRKSRQTKDSTERMLFKTLIEEGQSFGSSDDWGSFSTEFVFSPSP